MPALFLDAAKKVIELGPGILAGITS